MLNQESVYLQTVDSPAGCLQIPDRTEALLEWCRLTNGYRKTRSGFGQKCSRILSMVIRIDLYPQRKSRCCYLLAS